MKVSFRIQRHAIRDAEVVEIWCNGEFIGSLYGLQNECGVKIVSKYLPIPSAAILSVPDIHSPALEVRFRKSDEADKG